MISSSAKQVFRWFGEAVSVAGVAFAVLSYFGYWRHVRGDDLLIQLADHFDLSYTPNAAKPVYPGDPEWEPLIRVVAKYTHAILPKNRQPKTFARSSAVASASMEAGGDIIGEWTAPTTPIILFYRTWPNPGSGDYVKGKDFWVIGTLGDLHEWIRRDEADFDFLWRNLIFGGLSACVGIFLALPDISPSLGDARERIDDPCNQRPTAQPERRCDVDAVD